MKTTSLLIASLLSLSTLAELPSYSCYLQNQKVLSYTFDYEVNKDSSTFDQKKFVELIGTRNACSNSLEVLDVQKGAENTVNVYTYCSDGRVPNFSFAVALNCKETYLN